MTRERVRVSAEALARHGVTPGGRRRYVSPNRPGHPSLYQADYARIVYQLRLAGMPEKNIAEVFAVSLSTIMGWRRKHAKFGAAWDNGGTIADGELAHALFKRGKGYTHISEEVTYDVKRGGWVRTPVVKHYPPDVKAIQLMLTNRQPALWKNRTTNEMTGVEGKDFIPTIVIEGVNPRDVPDHPVHSAGKPNGHG